MKKIKNGLSCMLALVCLATVVYLFNGQNNMPPQKSTVLYDVIRVIDGDTFVVDLDGTEERVRLIGVDAPESVHPDQSKNVPEGKTASAYMNDLLAGKKIALEFDIQERDKYGRLLAYAYLDGNMVNLLLLESGNARLATYPPNVKYVDRFRKAQEQAQKEKIGLWG